MYIQAASNLHYRQYIKIPSIAAVFLKLFFQPVSMPTSSLLRLLLYPNTTTTACYQTVLLRHLLSQGPTSRAEMFPQNGEGSRGRRIKNCQLAPRSFNKNLPFQSKKTKLIWSRENLFCSSESIDRWPGTETETSVRIAQL